MIRIFSWRRGHVIIEYDLSNNSAVDFYRNTLHKTAPYPTTEEALQWEINSSTSEELI